VIYVHGRAKGVGEPAKSVQSKIYAALEGYGLAVIGFTWDAEGSGYDKQQPIASADDLSTFLKSLQGYLIENPSSRPPVLLAHSMGAIIIEELARRNDLTEANGKAIESLIFNAAAVETKHHADWLSKVSIAKRIYVLVNRHDRVLGFAGIGIKPDMLGRKLTDPLVAAVTYVDVGGLGVNHRYFVPNGQNKQVATYSFFEQALGGKAIDMSSIAAKTNGLDSGVSGIVWQMRNEVAKVSPPHSKEMGPEDEGEDD